MGKIYARQIMNSNGSYTINDVPNLWLSRTIQAFKDFVVSGEITEAQYKEYTGEDYVA